MLEWLWGLKTVAAMDFWTFDHILTGLSVGNSAKKHNRKHFFKMNPKLNLGHKTMIRFDLILVLFVAYLWETIEVYLEKGLAGEWLETWLQGSEFWANRLIFDPLMMVLGYYIATKYPKFIIPARFLSIIWLLVHIFIFPHSMYLHEIF